MDTEAHGLGWVAREAERRTGVESGLRALDLVRQVLEALDEVLVADELAALRAAVPVALRSSVPGRPRRADPAADRPFDRDRRCDLPLPPIAVEHTEAVCHLLGEMLPPDTRTRWARELPPPVAALFLADGPSESHIGDPTQPPCRWRWA